MNYIYISVHLNSSKDKYKKKHTQTTKKMKRQGLENDKVPKIMPKIS